MTLPVRCAFCGEEKLVEWTTSGNLICFVCSKVTPPVQKVEMR